MEQITQSKDISHYLNDFIMIHRKFEKCLEYMTEMQNMCDRMGAPLSEKKTVGPVHIITFLGLLIDLITQVIQIPKDKVDKAVNLLNQVLDSKNHPNKNQRGKIMVRLLQQITGTLNFFCHAIPSGYLFIGRMYKAIATVTIEGNKPNPKFKIRVNKGIEDDVRMWLKFLMDPSFARHREIPFTTFLGRMEDGPLIYVDSAGCTTKGFRCIFPEHRLWAFGAWPRDFFTQKKPNIMLLELYAIVIAVDTWAPLLRNKHVRLRSDNMSTVYELNKKSSRKVETHGAIATSHSYLLVFPDLCDHPSRAREAKRFERYLFKGESEAVQGKNPGKVPCRSNTPDIVISPDKLEEIGLKRQTQSSIKKNSYSNSGKDVRNRTG